MVDQVKQASEQAGQAAETGRGVAEGAAQQAVGSITGELRNLGRDVTVEALKVLSPAAKQAAERAAQEVVARGPGLVREYGPKLVGRAGSAAVGGVTGAVKGVAKAGTSAAGGLVSKLRPGGGGKRDSTPTGTGRGRRLPIQEWVDVGVPVEAAYAQWTQFEEFPKFMLRTERLEQKDDSHLLWHAKIWGVRRSWEAEITEQRPRERIVWKTTSGANHVGVITFHPLSHRLTRVQVNLDFQPTGLLEKTGSGVRATRRAVKSDLMRFKAQIEMREQPAGEWPGTIKEGEVVGGKEQAQGEEPEEERGEEQEPAAQEPAASEGQEPAAQEPAAQEEAAPRAGREPSEGSF